VAPTTFTTKGDAEAWLAEERKVVESGNWRPTAVRQAEARRSDRTETLSDYSTRWLIQRRVKGEPLRPRSWTPSSRRCRSGFD
jgi:hypothetical protein